MEGKERLESLVRNLSDEIEKEMSEINRIWTKNKQRKYVKRIQPCVCCKLSAMGKMKSWNNTSFYDEKHTGSIDFPFPFLG